VAPLRQRDGAIGSCGQVAFFRQLARTQILGTPSQRTDPLTGEMTMRPIQSILCPVDLERPSRTALGYAFFLAEAFYASLEVTCARAALPTLVPGTDSRQEEGGRAANSLNERIARDRLDELLRNVTTAVPGRASAHIVEGEPLSGILRCALQFRSDLIVVGSHFEARPDWHFAATLGEQIAYAAACPAISVHEGGQRRAPRVKHILMPVDFRSDATAVEWTTLFGRCFDATVELLQVRSMSGLAGESTQADRDGEHVKLDEVRDRLRASGIRVEETRSGEGTAFERIMKRTESGGCDLVVMAADPRTKTMSVIEPSLAASVRRHASIPILSARPPSSQSTVAWRRSEDETPTARRGASGLV